MNLLQFKKNPDGFTYHLKFNNALEFDLSTQQLRDNCPCAGCQGESVLLHKYEPVNKPELKSESYELHNAVIVGNYAIKLIWKDGHDTGIYTWEHLMNLINS
jgi:DUF971 family protein